jgi:hypothetical protein
MKRVQKIVPKKSSKKIVPKKSSKKIVKKSFPPKIVQKIVRNVLSQLHRDAGTLGRPLLLK